MTGLAGAPDAHRKGPCESGSSMNNADGLKSLQMQVMEGDQGDVRILLEGVLDRETVPDARKKLLRVSRREGLRHLSVDFSRIDRMDTAGIAVMVEVLRAVSPGKGVLRLEGLSEEARRLFRLARLEETFRVSAEPKVGV